ncbi:hypothetical protein LEUM_1249 [Leuconostoc mesenteroides subsp. mesenteroides ATCC 8293]|uniref:Uncharacterized protein n=1 Tax=Leuconostoc mesenteroides subsp. mesenteroides (strain ATCC 8293 / DSM 20343 / BCRC 11652 / CCM 1803 / JCM 6124 / NCDO 523 / NBRC 100496 / NCIMB 8023 / NCTC 12954 / NRRL B-1118 / 37Y) TaxID=203120 RepID=Q03WS6_LEUMM|nr:hypothetical protein LEUM_1249 [Leuconostoc mesenteroides subsp. mesenteroides ATCC 8293]
MSFLLMGQVTSINPATRRFISTLLESQEKPARVSKTYSIVPLMTINKISKLIIVAAIVVITLVIRFIVVLLDYVRTRQKLFPVGPACDWCVISF